MSTDLCQELRKVLIESSVASVQGNIQYMQIPRPHDCGLCADTLYTYTHTHSTPCTSPSFIHSSSVPPFQCSMLCIFVAPMLIIYMFNTKQLELSRTKNEQTIQLNFMQFSRNACRAVGNQNSIRYNERRMYCSFQS